MCNIVKNDKIKDTRLLHFIGAAYVDGYLWTSALEWNGYYKINIDTGEAECLGIFEYMDICENSLFYQVLNYQKFVFFIPWFSNYLVRLNTENLNMKYWKLPENIILEITKFRAANIYDNKIFMFPHYGNDICIFNIQTEKFECNRDWLEDYLKNVKWKEKDKFIDKFFQGCQKGNYVWLPNLSGNFMMKFNFITYQSEMILFPEFEGKTIDITENGENNLLVLTSLGNVWRYNINNYSKELVYKYSGKVNEPYRHILVIKDNFYLIPAKEKYIKRICKGKTSIVEYPSDWKVQYRDVIIGAIFFGYFPFEDKFLLYPCLGNKLLTLSYESLSGIKIYENIESREEKIFKYLDANTINRKALNEKKVGFRMFFNIYAEIKNGWEVNSILNIVGTQIWNSLDKEIGIEQENEGNTGFH